MGLRLTQPRTKTSSQPTPSLKFPAQAVRAFPAWAHRESAGLRLRTPEEIENCLSTGELVRNVEETIARMQANLNELQQDAREAILYPFKAAVEGSTYDRPRAA